MMRRLMLCIVGLCAVVAMTAIATSADTMAPSVVPAGSANWVAVTGMNGLSKAVLFGNPSKAGSGMFTVRYKSTSDVTFPAHKHPTDELVTVMSGTLLVGVGDKPDWTNAQTLTAGGFVGVPAGLHHYAQMKAGTVIEVSGMAPDTIELIQPSGSM